jgi:hypothetical protein
MRWKGSIHAQHFHSITSSEWYFLRLDSVAYQIVEEQRPPTRNRLVSYNGTSKSHLVARETSTAAILRRIKRKFWVHVL